MPPYRPSLNKEKMIKTPLLLKAALIGIVLMVVLSAISLVVYYPTMNSMFSAFEDPAMFDPNATTSDLPPGFERMTALVPLIALLSCLGQLIPGMTAGGLYARWYNQEEPLTPGAVKGGAAAGALTHAVGTLVTGVISLAVVLPMQMRMMDTISSNAGAPLPQFGGMVAIFGIFGLICGMLFAAVIGAGTGALGGLIGDSLTKGKSPGYTGGDVIG